MNLYLVAALLAAAPTQAQKDKAASAALTREQVYSRPLGPPGAVETLTVPLAGRAMAADGTVFSFSGSIVLTIEAKPPPPPPPVVTKLTGLRDPVSGALVTTAAVGQRLVLEGELLTSETLLVAVGGERAAVVSSSPTKIEFLVPPVPAGKPPVLILYFLVSNNWVEKGRLPLTIQGSTPIPPGPSLGFRVDGYEDGAGKPVTSLPINSPLVIVGSGFGAAAGKVLVNKSFSRVTSWSDTKISTRSGEGANRYHPVLLDVFRPGEGWVSGIVGPFVTMPGEGPLPK